MAYFYVQRPQYTTMEWFQFSALRLVFPPIFLWDALKWMTSRLAGGALGKLILQAQQYPDFIEPYFYCFKNKTDITYEQHTVITHDGVALDTFEISHGDQNNKQLSQRKYIIQFLGNGGCYEHTCPQLLKDAEDLKCSVIGFNYRGVVKSTGTPRSTDDLVTDGIAQVQRLLDHGVLAKHITLYGHSLGGGIAALVARHFHQQGQPIKVFNDRSFSSLTDVAAGWIPKLLHADNALTKTLSWLAWPIIKAVLSLTKWEINAASAFKAIPEQDREYMVVRTPRTRRESYVTDDHVIPHEASLHMALKSERRAQKRTFEGDEEALTGLKKKQSERKMEDRTWPSGDHHNMPLKDLKNRSGKTGAAFFHEFVERVPEPTETHLKGEKKI